MNIIDWIPAFAGMTIHMKKFNPPTGGQYLIFLIFLLFLFLNFNQAAAANGLEEMKKRVENIGQEPAFVSSQPLEATIGGIINGALVLVGTIFLILMVYGGYIWMLARGDEAAAKKAKDIITMAIIGIIVVLAAYTITYFIVYRLTAATGAGL